MSKITEFKQSNIQLVRECFYETGLQTKNALIKATHLSSGSVTNVLQYLLEKKEIIFVGEGDSTGGRKSKQYLLNKDFQHVGIINLMKTIDDYQLSSYIYNLSGELIDEKTIHSQKGNLKDLQVLLDTIKKDTLVSTLLICIPGICEQGTIRVCDYENLIGIDLKKQIEKNYNLKTVIENDVNVACVGLSSEYPEIEHLAFAYQPETDYVGCGLIINHKLYNGFSHFAGELRYLPYLTHTMQEELLKTNPKKLLTDQILTLCCVVNPQLIGYSSSLFEEEIDLNDYLDQSHQPKLIKINHIHDYILKGAYKIILKNIEEEHV